MAKRRSESWAGAPTASVWERLPGWLDEGCGCWRRVDKRIRHSMLAGLRVLSLALITTLASVPSGASILYVEVTGLVGLRSDLQPNGAPAVLYTYQDTLDITIPGNPVQPNIPDDLQQTIIAANTLVTARFAIDTSKMPPSQISPPHSDNSALPGLQFPSHFEVATVPWITATVEVNGLTFGSLLGGRDADPSGSFPTPPYLTSIFQSPEYRNLLSYGAALSNPDIEAFRTRVQTVSGYLAGDETNLEETLVYSIQQYNFDLQLVRQLLSSSNSFLEDPSALPVNFEWEDDVITFGADFFVDNGILNLNWSSFGFVERREVQSDGSLKIFREFDVSILDMGVQVTAVRAFTVDPAPVPEPASAGFVAMMLVSLCLLRKRCGETRSSK